MTGTTRPKRLKPVARVVPTTYYLGRNDTDGTCLFAVSGKRYEYHLLPQQLDTVEYLCKKVSILKALNYARSRNRPPIGTVAPSMS